LETGWWEDRQTVRRTGKQAGGRIGKGKGAKTGYRQAGEQRKSHVKRREKSG
jgi:hypothetical protein